MKQVDQKTLFIIPLLISTIVLNSWVQLSAFIAILAFVSVSKLLDKNEDTLHKLFNKRLSDIEEAQRTQSFSNLGRR